MTDFSIYSCCYTVQCKNYQVLMSWSSSRNFLALGTFLWDILQKKVILWFGSWFSNHLNLALFCQLVGRFRGRNASGEIQIRETLTPKCIILNMQLSSHCFVPKLVNEVQNSETSSTTLESGTPFYTSTTTTRTTTSGM